MIGRSTWSQVTSVETDLPPYENVIVAWPAPRKKGIEMVAVLPTAAPGVVRPAAGLTVTA
jgi:hypothetical protein